MFYISQKDRVGNVSNHENQVSVVLDRVSLRGNRWPLVEWRWLDADGVGLEE